MKAVALIPARLAATRFPNKLLADIKGKTVIHRTYAATVQTGLFNEVIVVTDSHEIREEIERHGGKVVMSKREYESGTDRIAEIAADMDADVFLNVQGDEPFTQKEPLAKLLEVFRGSDGAEVQVASLTQLITDRSMVADPNIVKVVLDNRNNSLLFSRSVIPFARATDMDINYYRHIGVYAFRKQALMTFPTWPMTPLEAAEKIECLRFLEHGIQLKMVITEHASIGIDVPEDVNRALAYMEKNGLE